LEEEKSFLMSFNSLSDRALPERIKTLISLSQRFGPVFPTYGVIPTPNNSWKCECRKGVACEHPGKHPRITRWNTAATTNEKQIADWCIEFPHANWAIVAGWLIDIVDLDAKPGKPNGVLAMEAWEAIHGRISTLRVASGTGIHLYHTAGSGLPESSNDRLGIDARADKSGYVMAPGSRHQNGRIYQIIEENELSACPAWLTAELYQNQPDTASVSIHCIHSKERGGGFRGEPAEAGAIPSPAYVESPVRRVSDHHAGRPTRDGGNPD
jgi:hypothetical protein